MLNDKQKSILQDFSVILNEMVGKDAVPIKWNKTKHQWLGQFFYR